MKPLNAAEFVSVCALLGCGAPRVLRIASRCCEARHTQLSAFDIFTFKTSIAQTLIEIRSVGTCAIIAKSQQARANGTRTRRAS